MGNNKPQYLFGWYQFQNFNSAFNVNIYFKNGNTQIGSGAFTTTTSQTSYKQFTININYTSILMPDSFSIVISMSDTFPSTNTCGSYYIIDDLSFDTNVGITESLLEKPQINFYPNPTNEMLNVEFKIFKENSSRIQLQNALGQILMDEKITCQHSSFNIQQLSSGMYFVKVIQGDKVLATKKLVKE